MMQRLSNGLLLSHDRQWITCFNNKLPQPHNQKTTHVSELHVSQLNNLPDEEFNMLFNLAKQFRQNPTKDNFGADKRTRQRWNQQQHRLDRYNQIQAEVNLDYCLSYTLRDGTLDPARPLCDSNWVKKHHYNQWWILYNQSDKFKRTTMRHYNMKKLRTAQQNIRKLKSRINQLESRERQLQKKLVRQRVDDGKA